MLSSPMTGPRGGWITASVTILIMCGCVGYLWFLIDRCSDNGYCVTVHDYRAHYVNYTIISSTTGITVQYKFVAVQEYICDEEKITDISHINRQKYNETEQYTIYVKSDNICTLKQPFSTFHLLVMGIVIILFVMVCCIACCIACFIDDRDLYRQWLRHMNTPYDPHVAYPIPVVVPVRHEPAIKIVIPHVMFV